MPTAMWHSRQGPGLDRCVLEPTPEGFRLGGTALVVAGDDAYEIRYSVITDQSWRTHAVGAHVQGPAGDRRLALSCDGDGAWTVADNPLIDLYGAVDVDLAWTPATNTLPIRRLDLDVGESAEIVVAHVDFPGHAVTRRQQRYQRTGEREYRFESGSFAASLVVDDHGLVIDYEGMWVELGDGVARTAEGAQGAPRAESSDATSHSPENS